MDQQAQTHTIALSNDTLLLDGLPSMISIVGADLHLVTEAGSYCVTAQALWYAFAGAEPTASDAGLLLADSLARWQALHSLLRSWQAYQDSFQQAVAQAQKIGSVPLPPYRLDPFVRQALLAFDGTEETTRVLSRILQLDPAVVVAHAIQLGLSGIEQSSEASCNEHTAGVPQICRDNMEASATPATALLVPQQERSAQRRSIRFTDEQITRIRTAYEQTTCVKDMVAELAQEFGCPEHAVRCKLYSLHLPKKRNTGSHQRETNEQTVSQEDDRSSQGEHQEA
jgi:hypothetical protein